MKVNMKYLITIFLLIVYIFSISCTGNSIDLKSSELIQLKDDSGEKLFRYNDSGCKGYYCASISLDWEGRITQLDLLKFGQWLYTNSDTKINENKNVTGKKYRIKIYHPPDFQECTWSNSNECNQYLIAFYYRDLDIHNQGVIKLYTTNGNIKEYNQPILNSDIGNTN